MVITDACISQDSFHMLVMLNLKTMCGSLCWLKNWVFVLGQFLCLALELSLRQTPKEGVQHKVVHDCCCKWYFVGNRSVQVAFGHVNCSVPFIIIFVCENGECCLSWPD